MKTVIFFFVFLIGGMLYLHQSLQDGAVLQYIDQHQQEKWVPQATYTIGQGYYLLQSLPEATTYFLRVAQRYPNQPLADDAYFAYLQCLEDSVAVSRADLVVGYQAYLEKYPGGKHAEIAQSRLSNYQTGAH